MRGNSGLFDGACELSAIADKVAAVLPGTWRAHSGVGSTRHAQGSGTPFNSCPAA